jgi:hypothetical protein
MARIDTRLAKLEARRSPEPITIIVLYVDVDGTQEEAYRVTCYPPSPNFWVRTMETDPKQDATSNERPS